jgi:hypothetical protein
MELIGSGSRNDSDIFCFVSGKFHGALVHKVLILRADLGSGKKLWCAEVVPTRPAIDEMEKDRPAGMEVYGRWIELETR